MDGLCAPMRPYIGTQGTYRLFQIVPLADIDVLCVPLTNCIGCPIRCALCLGCASRADVATTGWILDVAGGKSCT